MSGLLRKRERVEPRALCHTVQPPFYVVSLGLSAVRSAHTSVYFPDIMMLWRSAVLSCAVFRSCSRDVHIHCSSCSYSEYISSVYNAGYQGIYSFSFSSGRSQRAGASDFTRGDVYAVVD